MGAPTLIVGIGGIGGNIVCRIADKIEEEKLNGVELVIMDTDVNDLRKISEHYPKIHTVRTSPKGTVGKALDTNKEARDNWFPVNDGLTGKPFTEGAGQVRAVSRLAFDYAVEQGLMENLEKAIAKLHGLTGDGLRQEMRIIITGSIAGGTGSGLVLPVAMYIRNFLITRYQDNSAIIRGFFLEPDVVFGRAIDEEERNTQRANAYAAIRELNAFFRKEYSGEKTEYSHIVFNAPQPGLGLHVNYPNILPYHFVFLLDALNAEGDSLTDAEGQYDLESYKQYAADCIYTQALSTLSSRSNSSEDNVIRKLAANNGRSRYCGAGTSCLEYPKSAVQKYISLKWALQSVSGEWLEIDEAYKKQRKENPDEKIEIYYKKEFESKRNSTSPFYKVIFQNSDKKDKDGNIVEEIDNYIESLGAHIKNWAENTLVKDSRNISRALYGADGKLLMHPLQTEPDGIMALSEENDGLCGMFQSLVDNFYSSAKKYSSICQEEVPEASKTAARNLFTISDFEGNPLIVRDKDFQIESIFRVIKEGQTGSYHPAAVRFKLYKLMEVLEEKLTEAQGGAEKSKSFIINFENTNFYPEGETKCTPIEAVAKIFGDDGSDHKTFLAKLGKETLNEDTAEQLAGIMKRLTFFKKNIEEFCLHTAEVAFFEGALNYVKELAESYRIFYDYIGKEIDKMKSSLVAFEMNPEYNNQKGKAHRYVCASKECLEVMDKLCVKRGSGGNLPIELCGDIYTKLLLFAKKRKEMSENYSARNVSSSDMLSKLFDAVVLKYWEEAVVDPANGCKDIIDKSIIKALADEKAYTDKETYYDEKDRVNALEYYVKESLASAKRLSTPFIEPPIGETPRRINACAFADNIFDESLPFSGEMRRLLINSYNGIVDNTESFSPYKILFYSSLYGFCADNLPKYAPAHEGMENRPAGEYHRAYFHVINQLSPNLSENKLITPHIDKNWHLVRFLPEVNEENEKRINNDIVHSFLTGLIFRQFGADENADTPIFYVRAKTNSSRTNLFVSNGTACDKYYEVFDALEISPIAVNNLLEWSKERLEREKSDNMAGSMENSHLVKYIKSKAFSRFDANQAVVQLLEEIANYKILPAGEIASREMLPLNIKYNALGKRYDLMPTAVTDLFGFGTDASETRRTSIFEIPLLYKISLPQSDLREGKLDEMIDSIFSTILAHMKHFLDESELYYSACQLFEEQYLLFEHNLLAYSNAFPGICTNAVVSATREKALGFMKDSSVRYDRMNEYQPRIENAWHTFRENNR